MGGRPVNTETYTAADQFDEDGRRVPGTGAWHDRDAADDEYERQLAFRRDVDERLHRLRVDDAARERHTADKAAANPAPPFDAGTVAEIRQRPAPPPFRAEGLVPSAGGVLVVAQRKTGKTTLVLNWARSLLTGQDFLGRFPTRPVDGTVAILNFEVSGDTLARWAEALGVPGDGLYLVNLRGRRNPLQHPEDRQMLARQLRERGVEAVICDPFSRAFTGSSQNDPGEVGAWLADLDLFARGEVGAVDVMLTAHAGWNGERTRGSSALEDWADSVVWLARDQHDDTRRFLRAEGRDVLVEEDRVLFDPETRTLTLAGTGSRQRSRETAKVAELAGYVVGAARQSPGVGVAGLERAIRATDGAPSFRNGEVSSAAKIARDQGLLTIVSGGPGRPSEHYAVDNPPTPPNPSRTPPREDPPTPPTPPYRGGVGGGVPLPTPPIPADAAKGQRLCPDCSRPLPAGRVRCGPCFSARERSARIAAARAYGPPPAAEGSEGTP